MVSNQRTKGAANQDVTLQSQQQELPCGAAKGYGTQRKFAGAITAAIFGLLLPITGHADVSLSCRKKMTTTYKQVFSRSGMGYLTSCFVAELAYQGDQLGCGCSSATATDRFVECTRKRSKKDIFYAIGFHCGAAHRKGWADR